MSFLLVLVFMGEIWGYWNVNVKTSCSLPEERNPYSLQTSAGLCGSDLLHREKKKWQEEEAEEEEDGAHLGCQPVSPRLHRALMNLIDWWECQEVWAEQSADPAPVLGRKINLADTSRARSAPHRASIHQLWLIEEQSKVRLCLRINTVCHVWKLSWWRMFPITGAKYDCWFNFPSRHK